MADGVAGTAINLRPSGPVGKLAIERAAIERLKVAASYRWIVLNGILHEARGADSSSPHHLSYPAILFEFILIMYQVNVPGPSPRSLQATFLR